MHNLTLHTYVVVVAVVVAVALVVGVVAVAVAVDMCVVFHRCFCQRHTNSHLHPYPQTQDWYILSISPIENEKPLLDIFLYLIKVLKNFVLKNVLFLFMSIP